MHRAVYKIMTRSVTNYDRCRIEMIPTIDMIPNEL